MKKWVVKFFEQKEINYIVDAETGDKAVEIACYKLKLNTILRIYHLVLL